MFLEKDPVVLTLTSFHLPVLTAATALFAAAAFFDVRSYRIPNYLSAALLALFPFYALTSPSPLDWRQNAVVFAAAVLVGLALFLANLFGAGDIKLLSSACLWAGPHLIALLLTVTAFAGGVEALAYAAARGLKTRKVSCLAKTEIPYGVAIATGGLVVLGALARPVLLSD